MCVRAIYLLELDNEVGVFASSDLVSISIKFKFCFVREAWHNFDLLVNSLSVICPSVILKDFSSEFGLLHGPVVKFFQSTV